MIPSASALVSSGSRQRERDIARTAEMREAMKGFFLPLLPIVCSDFKTPQHRRHYIAT